VQWCAAEAPDLTARCPIERVALIRVGAMTARTVESADAVALTDLEIIQRYSLAVRQASADRSELVAALKADLAWLEGRRAAKRAAAVDGDGGDVNDDDGDEGDDAPAPRASAPAKRAAPRSSATTRSAKSASGRTTKAASARSTKAASTRTTKATGRRTTTTRRGTSTRRG
jgi:hypothetical protein